MRATRFIVLFLLPVSLTGCYTKRTLVPEPKADDSASAGSRQRPVVMNHAIQSQPARMLSDSGAEAFVKTRLNEQGLPGLPRSSPGTLETNLKMESTPGEVAGTRTVRFTRVGDPNPYIYTVEQTEQPPGWRIASACQTDSNGKILKQFEPK